MPGSQAFDSMVLLPMKPPDVDEVVEIEKACFASPWSRRAFLAALKSKWTRLLTAVAGDRIIGYAGIRLGRSAHILNIAVLQEFRRHHIGSRILSRLLELSEQWGATRVFLEVRASNTAARELYRKFGFSAIALKKDYYTQMKEDAIVMAREVGEENGEGGAAGLLRGEVDFKKGASTR